ncbi:MAG: hypothetical protein DRO00_07590 [Thermoproteota archaeon]|nr:MAG: hypothetical protein DRO00_07590 [Candidatus Korarchaeota archaeon]
MRTLFFGLERLALRFIIGLIINAVVLWISQIVVLPKEKERSFLSVLMLALIGAILTSLLSLIPLIGWLIGLIAWIWLIKSWFNIGWFQSIAIAVLAFIIGVIISTLLGLGLLLAWA